MTYDIKGAIRNHPYVFGAISFFLGSLVGEFDLPSSKPTETYLTKQKPAVVSAYLAEDEDTGRQGLLVEMTNRNQDALTSSDGINFRNPRLIAEQESAKLIDRLNQQRTESELKKN
jgi:hypothetical protein